MSQGKSFWRDDILVLSGKLGGDRLEEQDEDDGFVIGSDGAWWR